MRNLGIFIYSNSNRVNVDNCKENVLFRGNTLYNLKSAKFHSRSLNFQNFLGVSRPAQFSNQNNAPDGIQRGV